MELWLMILAVKLHCWSQIYISLHQKGFEWYIKCQINQKVQILSCESQVKLKNHISAEYMCTSVDVVSIYCNL